MKTLILASSLFVAAILLFSGCSKSPEKAFADAQRSDDIPAYKRFVATYPASSQAEVARKRTRELQAKLEWDTVRVENRREAVVEYLNNNPASPYAQDAKAVLAILGEEDAFKQATEKKRLQDCLAYLAAYPTGRHLKAMSELLTTIEDGETERLRSSTNDLDFIRFFQAYPSSPMVQETIADVSVDITASGVSTSYGAEEQEQLRKMGFKTPLVTPTVVKSSGEKLERIAITVAGPNGFSCSVTKEIAEAVKLDVGWVIATMKIQDSNFSSFKLQKASVKYIQAGGVHLVAVKK